MDRLICVHGHFYQPPRENPWLEEIEVQDSAYPYHDWNERITAECYAPNATSRILNDRGEIRKIVNNYSQISFNFGPTLLSWIEAKNPDVYQEILTADEESIKRFSGHGSAMAQCFNHMIMPLANRRDKVTQIQWGLRDFEKRFKRQAEGMWLPETAVDLETLDILAEAGIRFTILAPHQAKRLRKMGAQNWHDINGGIDPTRGYRLNLSSGRSIAIFFYDGPVSRSIAFEGLLVNGEVFSKRLNGIFSGDRAWPQLAHVATDGETYGHHHRHGDMALAYALDTIETKKLAVITNYGEFLEKFPPAYEVEIHENTSWSCAHGIERWRSDCGCRISNDKWNQAWRAPLRNALDWLRDTLAPLYEQKARDYLNDPWAARNDYISIVLNREISNVDAFLGRQAHHIMNEGEKVVLLKLLEMQRHAMYMYTSCGWFFDDISGIEAVQVLAYAARALQLAGELFGQDFEKPFLELLKNAKSNIDDRENGEKIYNTQIKPAMVDVTKMAAHYAVSSLFEMYESTATIYCYDVESQDYHSVQAGDAKMALGRVRVKSKLTYDQKWLIWGVLYTGSHNLSCGVAEFKDDASYSEMVNDMMKAFSENNLTATLKMIDRHFGGSLYSLKSLLGDQQRRIFRQIMGATMEDIETTHRQIYEKNATLIQFLASFRMPLPKALSASTEFVLNADLRRAIEAPEPNLKEIQGIFEEAKACRVQLDQVGLTFLIEQAIEKVMLRLASQPKDVVLIRKLEAALELVGKLPFELNLWKIQNIFYDIVHQNAADWTIYQHLGEKLHVRLEPALVQ